MIYIQKHLKPGLDLDEELNPSNVIKPGLTRTSIAERQNSWTRQLGLPLNVIAEFKNTATDDSLVEELLHDFYAGWRIRYNNGYGGRTRETASNVPLGYQAMGVCFAANATQNEVDPADFKKFAPRQSAINWVMKKITKIDQAVREGLGQMRYGKLHGTSADGNLEWIDGPFFKDERTQSEMNLGSVVAHDLVMKFAKNKMPEKMNFCEYKSPKIIVNA